MNEILTFEKLLLSELRIVSISNINNDIMDNDMVKAVTVNEELLALGYTLTPADIVNLAKSNDIDNFLNKFKGIIGNVNAKPMYPNYPNQVMNMDEATFRFHQLLHYVSTYGIENFANIDVVRGWLPDVEDTEKIFKAFYKDESAQAVGNAIDNIARFNILMNYYKYIETPQPKHK